MREYEGEEEQEERDIEHEYKRIMKAVCSGKRKNTEERNATGGEKGDGEQSRPGT